jgi:alanyl-tRNA synthetase
LTDNTSSEQDRPTIDSPKPLTGEVIGLEETRVRVRLASGTVGFVLNSESSGDPSLLGVGQLGVFRILRCNEEGETVLRLVSVEDAEAPRSFEHDVHRLQSAINHHHATPISHEEVIPTMDEQRIQQWLKRVETRLEQLRRNRSKRLDEEFYSGS